MSIANLRPMEDCAPASPPTGCDKHTPAPPSEPLTKALVGEAIAQSVLTAQRQLRSGELPEAVLALGDTAFPDLPYAVLAFALVAMHWSMFKAQPNTASPRCGASCCRVASENHHMGLLPSPAAALSLPLKGEGQVRLQR